MSPDISAQILDVLARVAETDEVRTNPDLALYDLQVLDSMKTVELIVALGSELGVEISPAEFEREAWATPRKLIEDVAATASPLRPDESLVRGASGDAPVAAHALLSRRHRRADRALRTRRFLHSAVRLSRILGPWISSRRSIIGAARLPDRAAHRSGDRTLTYGELLAALRLARRLARGGVRRRTARPIAVRGHKEPEMLIAFLGAVKSGRPYVPIDLAIPAQRAERIVADRRRRPRRSRRSASREI